MNCCDKLMDEALQLEYDCDLWVDERWVGRNHQVMREYKEAHNFKRGVGDVAENSLNRSSPGR